MTPNININMTCGCDNAEIVTPTRSWPGRGLSLAGRSVQLGRSTSIRLLGRSGAVVIATGRGAGMRIPVGAHATTAAGAHLDLHGSLARHAINAEGMAALGHHPTTAGRRNP